MHSSFNTNIFIIKHSSGNQFRWGRGGGDGVDKWRWGGGEGEFGRGYIERLNLARGTI